MSNSSALIAPNNRMDANIVVRLKVEADRISIVTRTLFEILQHRWAIKRFGRFSDHRLQDIGFQREWDGSVQRLNR